MSSARSGHLVSNSKVRGPRGGYLAWPLLLLTLYALLLHVARLEAFLADAAPGLLVAERIRDLTRTLTTDLVGHSVDLGRGIGGINPR